MRRRIVPALATLAVLAATAAASAYEPWDVLPGLASLLALFCIARMAERPVPFALRCGVLALALASVALIRCFVPQEAAVGTWWTALRTLWHGLSAAVFVLGLRPASVASSTEADVEAAFANLCDDDQDFLIALYQDDPFMDN